MRKIPRENATVNVFYGYLEIYQTFIQVLSRSKCLTYHF